MHYLLRLSSSANPDQNVWVPKLSKNSILGVQMTCRTHWLLSPWCLLCHALVSEFLSSFIFQVIWHCNSKDDFFTYFLPFVSLNSIQCPCHEGTV